MTAASRPVPADDLAPLLAEMVATDRFTISPDQQRAEYAEFVSMFRGPEPPFAGTITDEVIETVKVRRYRPDNERDRGHVLIYFHGGGWVLGSADTHDRLTRAIASELGLHVISVDYRLAPEHPFPAAFEDCKRVVAYAARGATWVGVGGDSAGGNLAAAVSAERAANGEPVNAQVLIYPGLDVPAAVADKSLDGLGLDRGDIDYFWSSYRGNHQPDARLAPLLAPDPIAAPATLVTTAGCDQLLPDGVRYAQRLIAAGVSTVYLPFPGLIHGWLELAEGVPSAGQARALLIEAIGQLHRSTSQKPRSD
ncbi:alpha/beta hydrolase [Mesorhizobium sp. CU2]|uniref:alpha/beta hydrolase n=1 Tax=unclassified Mesorhizobium TaxID=325217 RepID=UPI0011275993|nr:MULTISPECIES: alpha/beta hydrolase [unclassified Mesorhizobium]TPN81096.1 alpha/beta hydrolase [Mesorhizobium sp. CU3]TPO11683.1 alpha/beta hydrolase [Mesorhizobium sp. CU2]